MDGRPKIKRVTLNSTERLQTSEYVFSGIHRERSMTFCVRCMNWTGTAKLDAAAAHRLPMPKMLQDLLNGHLLTDVGIVHSAVSGGS